MAKLLRSLPIFTFRPNLKPSFLIPFSLSSLNFTSHPPSSSISQRTHCNTAPVAATSHVSEYQNRTPDPPHPAKDTSLEWVSRTSLCGHLGEDDVGKRITLCGWVALHRVHGGVTFVNLRDHSGIIQITTLPNDFPDAHAVVNDLKLEYVVAIEGVVRLRPSEAVNKKMKTGMVEVAAEHVKILNSVKVKLPFLVTTADGAKDSVKEEIRLRYRCLDLRRHQRNSNIMLRHRVVKLIRRYLEDVLSFVEGRLKPQCFLGLPLRVLEII